MNKTGIKIRLENENDRSKVESLNRESFWNVYRPGCYEHYLIHVMRDNPDFISSLDYVLEKDGEIIGHCAFVKSQLEADDGRVIPTITLGPICIANEYKRLGYGKMLLDYCFDRAKELGYGAVFFEGNIDFYEKCGCVLASQYGVRYFGMPEGEEAGFSLCRLLKDGYLDGVSGVYKTPQVYFVEDDDVEAFDRNFPPKEKLKLPGQLV